METELDCGICSELLVSVSLFYILFILLLNLVLLGHFFELYAHVLSTLHQSVESELGKRDPVPPVSSANHFRRQKSLDR